MRQLIKNISNGITIGVTGFLVLAAIVVGTIFTLTPNKSNLSSNAIAGDVEQVLLPSSAQTEKFAVDPEDMQLYSWTVTNNSNRDQKVAPYKTLTATSNWHEYSYVNEYFQPYLVEVAFPIELGFEWEEKNAPIGVALVKLDGKSCFENISMNYQSPAGISTISDLTNININLRDGAKAKETLQSDHGGTIVNEIYCVNVYENIGAVIKFNDSYNLSQELKEQIVASISVVR